MQLKENINQFDYCEEEFAITSLAEPIGKTFKDVTPIWSKVVFLINIVLKILGWMFCRNHKRNKALNEIWNETIVPNANDTVVRAIQIHTPNEVVSDLNCRLGATRFGDDLNSSEKQRAYLRRIVSYWGTEFNWKKSEKELNKFSQFMTEIEGLDIHFIHTKTTPTEDRKRIALLLIHDWPGSCADFRKVIPHLTTTLTKEKFAFEIVCPSLPGSGFSQRPTYPQSKARKVARILLTLMGRLGYSQFYVHGYGWGSITASLMARYYPNRVKGLHVTMRFSLSNSFDSIFKRIQLAIFPFLIYFTKYQIFAPVKRRMLTILGESGYYYFHINLLHDLGCAVADSPAGMISYFLERFSFYREVDSFRFQAGDETAVDELLTNATLAWINNNFMAAATLHKESLKEVYNRIHERTPLTVPCGMASFHDDTLPKDLLSGRVENLVSYSVMPKCSHFAALEKPELLAADICKFVLAIENTCVSVF